ncbi:hypothetical protein ABB02_00846 [Clostridiaceae bacterium JG1575]|nr:hypothetical protein ABB02_00846 [Clostridiaceae bacterium JG1575]
MKALTKEFFRSLKRNIARFLSILFIIALGVGFFAGINATEPDMLRSAALYYERTNLMDLRARNPLGFTAQDVQALSKVPGIEQMQVSYSEDLFLVHGDDKSVVRLYSMDLKDKNSERTMNQVEVLEGRLPEKSGEIVLATGKYLKLNVDLGTTVRFEESQGKALSDVLADQEYTVVGFIRSPLYIGFEREYTNVGNGYITTFIYVPEEDFRMKKPTEYFFKTAHTRGVAPETAEYKECIAPVKEAVNTLGKDAMARETKELRQKVADNKTTLAKERKKVQEALDNGQRRLDQAALDLITGRQKLTEEEAAGKATLADGKAKLLESRKALLDGRLEYNKGSLTYQENLLAYEKGKAVLDQKNMELSTAKAQLDAARLRIDQGQAALKQNKAALDNAKAQIELFGTAVKGLNEVYDSIKDQKDLTQEEYDRLLQQIEKVSKETAQFIRTYLPYTTPNLLQALRDFLKTSIGQVNASYESAKASYESGRAQYEAAQKELAQAQRDYEVGLRQYEAGKEKLDAGYAELAVGKKKLDAGKATLDASKKKLDDGEVEIAKAQLALEEGEKKLTEQLTAGREKLAQGEKDLKAAQKTYAKEKEKANQQLKEADEKILNAERKILEIPDRWYVTGRDGNPGYTSWFDNADKIGSVAKVFPFFFFLVAALVSLTTITRMVEEERSQAGTLKALGYRNGSIGAKYVVWALLASLIGSVVGLVFGFNVFPRIIMNAYGMIYSIPHLAIEFNLFFALLSLGLAVLSAVGAAAAAMFAEIRERPASLMQPKAPRAGKRILLERIRPLWKRLSFSQKVTFRNLFLYKKRFWMTVLGIAGCMGLLLTGFGIKDSVDDIVKNQFREIFTFQQMVRVDPKKPPQERDLPKILKDVPEVAGYELFESQVVKAKTPHSDRTYDVQLTVPQNPSKMAPFVTLRTMGKKTPLSLNGDGVVITQKMADMLKLHVGDDLSYLDADNNAFKVRVKGIAENYIENYLYMSPAFFERTHKLKPDYNAAWINLTAQGKAQETQVQEDLMKHPSVLAVLSAKELSNNFDDQIKSLIYVVIVLILSAGVLAFIVLYNLSNVNITERVRELATIKVLGFRDKEVSAYVYRENMILTLVGAFFGIGLGLALHQYIMRTMEIDNMMFGKYIHWPSYLYAVLLTFAFSILVNFIMHFVLKRINMVESLKSLE